MGISRMEVVDPQLLRHADSSVEIRPDEKPSDWIKRVTGRKPNERRK